jgi:hypothetical protein
VSWGGPRARLAGLEPATGCLEGTSALTGIVRDVSLCVSSERLDAPSFMMVATSISYRSFEQCRATMYHDMCSSSGRRWRPSWHRTLVSLVVCASTLASGLAGICGNLQVAAIALLGLGGLLAAVATLVTSLEFKKTVRNWTQLAQ